MTALEARKLASASQNEKLLSLYWAPLEKLIQNEANHGKFKLEYYITDIDTPRHLLRNRLESLGFHVSIEEVGAEHSFYKEMGVIVIFHITW